LLVKHILYKKFQPATADSRDGVFTPQLENGDVGRAYVLDGLLRSSGDIFTPLAERIREIVLSLDNARGESMPPTAELLLMFAARAVHLTNFVEPSLRAGRWVVCDRFIDATYAYQGGGRRLNAEHIRQLDAMVVGARRPDLTVLLDAPVEQALERARQRNAGAAADRFESERAEFFERVRDAYRARAAAEPTRIAVVDASQSVDRVASQILELLVARSWIS